MNIFRIAENLNLTEYIYIYIYISAGNGVIYIIFGFLMNLVNTKRDYIQSDRFRFLGFFLLALYNMKINSGIRA